MKNGISIDVEEYFHAVNLRAAFPQERWQELAWRAEVGVTKSLRLLERSGHKGTFFVLGWIAEQQPELVRAIRAEGHEIASHGTSHQMAGELGIDGFREDVARSIELLEPLAGAKVRGFRASTFSVTRETSWAVDVLAELGLDYDSSIFPVRHDRYGVPDFARHPTRLISGARQLVELPMLTWRLWGTNLPAAGGGYLRQFPLWYTRRAIAQMNREGYPAVLYLHPWELDPDQPRAAPGVIGRIGHLRHYRNLDKTEDRLARLLDEFEYAPLAAMADAVPADAVTHWESSAAESA